MKPVFSLVALIVLLAGGLGFIHALTDNNTAFDFDDATWLTGAAAEDAAIEAGLCTEETRGECTPNDFFIKNEVVKDERLVLDPNTLVLMMTWRMEETSEVAPHEISLADFATLINDPALHWSSLPYAVVVADSVVVQIEEVYVP